MVSGLLIVILISIINECQCASSGMVGFIGYGTLIIIIVITFSFLIVFISRGSE